MKPIILFLITLLFFTTVFCQEEEGVKSPYHFKEFTISGNRSIPTSYGTEGRFGGGIGMYHSFVLGKQLDLVLGGEYNYSSLFADRILTHSIAFPVEENLTFHIHSLSLPLSFRLNVGKGIKTFLSCGIFQDISYASKIGDDYRMKQHNLGWVAVLNISPSVGIGLRIPMKKNEWILKADYKIAIKVFGMNDHGDSISPHYFQVAVGIRKPTFRAK